VSRKKAHREPAIAKTEELVRELRDIQRVMLDAPLALIGPYKLLYRDVYDSASSGSSVRVTGSSGGGNADSLDEDPALPHSDPVIDLIDSRDHQKLHAAALSIFARVQNARRELDNARSEMEQAVGRTWKQPPHSRKGYVSEDDFKAAIARRKDRMSAGGEMERIQESGR
jgi:hypothetical protein